MIKNLSPTLKFILILVGITGSLGAFAYWNYKKEQKQIRMMAIHGSGVPESEFFFDLENNSGITNTSSIKEVPSYSGSHASVMNESEYGITFERSLGFIKDYRQKKSVDFSFYIRSNSPIKDAIAILTIFDENGEQLDWKSSSIVATPGQWSKSNHSFQISISEQNENSILRLYVWNKGMEHFLIDDIAVFFR